MNFLKLNILSELDNALKAEGITAPTAIQEKAIPPLLNFSNAYISSETGTGKTLAFLLPILTKLDAASKNLQAIILTPTNELASQIQDQLLRLNQNSDLNFRSQLLIGSGSSKRQLEKLKKKPHIIVGSPGRIFDFIKKRKLKVHTLNSLVIDEADKMLLDESLKLIEKIIRSLPRDVQKIFVSATNQPKSNSIAEEICGKIKKIHTGTNKIANNIEHSFIIARENEKPEILLKFFQKNKPKKTIIFAHKNETAANIAKHLIANRIAAGEIHGKCDKHQKVQTLAKFKNGKIKALVASDIAARGLDINNVSHIINYDIPGQSKNYLHRAGRTGRMGKNGCCLSLITPEEKNVPKRFDKELKIKFNQITINE